MEKTENMSVDQVFEIIKAQSMNFSTTRLKKLPNLKFRYVEEDHPEEFFLPYCWTLVYAGSTIYWIAEKICIFNALNVVPDDLEEFGQGDEPVTTPQETIVEPVQQVKGVWLFPLCIFLISLFPLFHFYLTAL